MNIHEKRFILHSDKQKQSCINFITGLSLETLFAVTIDEYEKLRTLEQNSRYWPLLQLVADNIPDEQGELHSKEYWHYRLRSEWGYIIGTCQMKVNGIKIDAPMPKSTTQMSTHEMSEYQEKIVELLIEHGVPLPEWIV